MTPLAAALLVQLLLAPATAALVDYVDPLIGSGGGNGLGSFASANVHPGAQAPFSFLRLGPDTTWARADGTVVWVPNDHLAGYNYNDTHVLAFSHTHIQGGGCGDLGNFGVALSASANVSTLVAGSSTQGDAPYKTPLVHGPGEAASPGFYSLELPAVGAGSRAAFAAAGTHSGMHVYECLAPVCTLLFDVCHNTHTGGCPSANASFAGDSVALAGSGDAGAAAAAAWQINASVLDYGYFAVQGGGVWVHASARLELFLSSGTVAAVAAAGSAAPPSEPQAGLWSARVPLAPAPSGATLSNDTSGSVGFWVTTPGPARFELRVGLSLVSQAGAAANLDAEQQAPLPPGAAGSSASALAPIAWLSFDELRARTAAVWEAELGRVELGVGAAPPDDNPTSASASAPSFCPPPEFDPWYVAQLAAYFNNSDGALFLARQGLPADASGAAIATHIWALSCYSPPPLTAAGWRTVLYTSLYHALCAPTTVSDADGVYVGLDGRVHSAPATGLGTYFSDLSIWDIHRTQAPLLALLAPAAATTLSASLLAMAEARGGVLPRWPFASVETGIMCADHAIAVLADAIAKGVPGLSAPAAWAAANTTLAVRDNASAYPTLGWVPLEEGHGWCKPASLTLEYAQDDAAAAVLASAAGDTTAAATLRARSGSYRNLWSPAVGGFCPRHANGSFVCTNATLRAPFPFEGFWTEANADQEAFYVPGDPAGLVSLFGGAQPFLTAYDRLLAATPAWPFGNFMPNAALWAGNEPSLLIPWQAAFAPPDGSARVAASTRALLRAYYTTRFDGVPGNDDYGTMSAGAVFALLGLYPLAGDAEGRYVLGSPTFANVSVALGTGAGAPRLTVIAHNASSRNVYVAAAALNGARLDEPFVRHADLTAPPALLEFEMTDTPTPWGSAG